MELHNISVHWVYVFAGRTNGAKVYLFCDLSKHVKKMLFKWCGGNKYDPE